jgi:hypothetical protein
MTTFQEGDEVKTMDENTMTTSSVEDITLEDDDRDLKTTLPQEGRLNDEDATTTYDDDITLENDDEDVKTTFPEVKDHLVRVPMALPGLGEALGKKKGIQHCSIWKRIKVCTSINLYFVALQRFLFNFVTVSVKNRFSQAQDTDHQDRKCFPTSQLIYLL